MVREAHTYSVVPGEKTASALLEEFKAIPRFRRAVPQDMWGLSCIFIVKDLPDMLTRKATFTQAFQLLYGFCACAINLALQLKALEFIHKLVVIPAVHRIQSQYARFHQECFASNGTFLTDNWQEFEYQKELCQAVIQRPDALCVVLYIWTLRIVHEIQEVVHLGYTLSLLPHLPPGACSSDMVLEEDEIEIKTFDAAFDTVQHIVAMDGQSWVGISILVLLPKIAIAIFLWFRGVVLLASTESFAELIFNALALEFVLGIDELVYLCFYPRSFRRLVEKTKFEPPKLRNEEMKQMMQMALWGHGAIAVLASIIVAIYYYNLQQVLPNYTEHYQSDLQALCLVIEKQNQELRCYPFQTDCFPFGSDEPNAA